MRNRFVLGLLLAGASSAPALANVRLPAVFSDHMVLQEGREVAVWGDASAGEAVTVSLGKSVVKTVASKKGHWRVSLPAMTSSFDPATIVVKGDNEVVFKDVLVGDVWLASGQSNMEFALGKAARGGDEVAAATHPGLRLFRVLRGETVPEKTIDVNGTWTACTPETAGDFSAVGYFFGRRLMQNLKKPIGVIDTSWGGTPVEAWTSEAGLRANPEGKGLLRGLNSEVKGAPKTPQEKAAAVLAYKQASEVWEAANHYPDDGNEGESLGFAKAGIPQDGWQKIELPSHWEDAGLDGDGSVWFRKDVQLPAAWVGKDLRLSLGVLNDCDTTYVAGEKVGQSCRQTPTTHGKSRTFEIPAKLAKPGRLLVAVRVFDERGRGGFSSEPESLYLQLATGGGKISLAGRWNYRVERLLPTMAVKWDLHPKPPQGYPHPHAPHALWDAMVAPMVPYSIRGAIWYQGEANASRAVQYRTLFAGLIKDWRKQWGQGDFPFHFVQLANFIDKGDAAEWPELRESQTMALNLPNTGMAVAIDIGNPKDIHPTNKLDVGERLARWALANDYKQPVVASGPLFKSAKAQGARFQVTFSFAAGLKAADPELRGFTLAGADKKFVPAKAIIDGETVLVSAEGLTKPVAVRYGWLGSPDCNLQNAEGLPASPFRSDAWPEVTKGRH
jgi:sialate O-acetylesterase